MKRCIAFVLTILLAACGSKSEEKNFGWKAAEPVQTTTTVAPKATTSSMTLPLALSRPAVATRANNILLLGGLTTGDVSTDAVVSFDAKTSAIARLNPLATKVHDAAATPFGADGALVFAGGGATITANVQQWNPSSSSKIGTLPQLRADLVASPVGNRNYVLGGTNGKALDTDVLSTTDGISFTKAGTLAQGVRYPAIVARDAKIWLFGGETQASEGGTAARTDVIQTFDTDTGQATIIGHLPQAISHAMAFIGPHGTMVAGGRTNNGAIDTIFAVDDAGIATQVAKLPIAISDSGVGVIGTKAYLFGGEVAGPADPRTSIIVID